MSLPSSPPPTNDPTPPEQSRLLRGLGGADEPLFSGARSTTPAPRLLPLREPPPLAPVVAELVEPEPEWAVLIEDAPPNPTACPRCQGPLIDPQGLGWCRKCGYCRSIEEDRDRLPVKPAGVRSMSPLGIVEFFQLCTKIPAWIYIMLIGCVGVVLASLPPAFGLAPNSLPRTLWSTIQIGVGMATIFAAQLILVFALAPSDDKLNFMDALLPFRLWGMAFKKAGQLRVPFLMAAWGYAAIASAILVIGGLDFWTRFLPDSKRDQPTTTILADPSSR
jgi:hypothetical protein